MSDVDYMVPQFDFHARTANDASKELLQFRSENFKLRDPTPDNDIWKLPAPDFRLQNFAPGAPPRNSRDAMKPWEHKTDKDNYYNNLLKERKETLILPNVMKPKAERYKGMDTTFQRLDPEQARRTAAQELKFKEEPYEKIRPHDFRPLPPLKQLGLDEFDTTNEKDPFNLKFESERLRSITGPPPQIVPREVEPGHFVPFLNQPPKWEARLHLLPRGRYPTKSGRYTRYRRMGRDPKSAFMDTVEEKLTCQWAKRKFLDSCSVSQQ